MYIVGVDYHPSFQHIAFLDQETGECGDRRLNHSDGEAEKFYRELRQKGISVRVGLEATGYSRWFERLLTELGIEVWIGNAAEIKAKRVRKQKTDRQDAQLLLKLLEENRFPRIWVPSPGESGSAATALAPASAGANAHADHESAAGAGDERRPALQAPLVERARASGVGEVSASSLGQPAPARFTRTAGSADSLDRRTYGCRRAGSQEVAGSTTTDDAPGSGAADRSGLRADHRNTWKVPSWQADRQLPWLIPSEESSGGRQRLGHISKQGNALLRFFLVEAAQAAARCNQDWRQKYWHLAMRREKSIAKVALGRQLAVRLYWMWRNGCGYAQSLESVRTRDSSVPDMACSKAPST